MQKKKSSSRHRLLHIAQLRSGHSYGLTTYRGTTQQSLVSTYLDVLHMRQPFVWGPVVAGLEPDVLLTLFLLRLFFPTSSRVCNHWKAIALCSASQTTMKDSNDTDAGWY